jgi:alpha-tubulin suppressor-like RCC1 family protein
MKCLKHHAQRLATGLLLGLTLFAGIIATPQVFAAYKQISAGYQHTCALTTDGAVVCWGDNYSGQANAPSGTFTQVSAGHSHTCGLKTDGTAVCWGAGKTNEGGLSSEQGQSIVPNGIFIQLSAGASHTCGLKIDGTAACWGAGQTNQINNIPVGGSTVEVGQSIVPSGTFTQISAGGLNTCGLRSDSSITCWSSLYSVIPSGTFTQISSSLMFHNCALKTDGTAVCWNDNRYGQADVPSGTFTQISAGGAHTCGLKTDGTAVCWGDTSYAGVINVPSGTFTQLSVGDLHVCGLRNDGSVTCWGNNDSGQSTPPDDTTLPVVSQCTTFTPPAVNIPCVNVGGTVYQAKMNVISTSPTMRFEVDQSSLQASNLIPNEQCAAFPAPNTSDHLRINCLDLGDKYWVDLKLVPTPNVIQFDLVNYAKN